MKERDRYGLIGAGRVGVVFAPEWFSLRSGFRSGVVFAPEWFLAGVIRLSPTKAKPQLNCKYMAGVLFIPVFPTVKTVPLGANFSAPTGWISGEMTSMCVDWDREQ